MGLIGRILVVLLVAVFAVAGVARAGAATPPPMDGRGAPAHVEAPAHPLAAPLDLRHGHGEQVHGVPGHGAHGHGSHEHGHHAPPTAHDDTGHGDAVGQGAGDCTGDAHDCLGCAQHCGSALTNLPHPSGLIRVDARLAHAVPDDRGSGPVRHRFDRPPRPI